MMSNDTSANDYVMSNNILTHMYVIESAAPISFTKSFWKCHIFFKKINK